MNMLLIYIAAAGLIVQAFIGLTFIVSCIWEKEPRATVFATIQFSGMLALTFLFFYLVLSGFFDTRIGFSVLIIAIFFSATAVYFLARKAASNQKALLGTKGFIVEEVKRFDERDQVFARNRALRPGSDQYKAYYRANPEKEAYDTQRRKKGGATGRTGSIDKPHEKPNVAASAASAAMSIYLSRTDRV